MESNTNKDNQDSLSTRLMPNIHNSEIVLPHCSIVSTQYTSGDNPLAKCLSIYSPDNVSFELDRVESITFLHVLIILCTDVFLIFQNTLSIFVVGRLLRIPSAALYFTSVLCALATSLQVVLARGFKIVMTPIYLTLQQRCLLNTIETQLERLKLKEDPHELLVLLSPAEKKSLEGALFSWCRSRYKRDFYYALLRLADEQKISFHLLFCEPNSFSQVKEHLETHKIATEHYRILNYSPEYFLYTPPSAIKENNPKNSDRLIIDIEQAPPVKKISLVSPHPSLLRFLNNAAYRNHVSQRQKIAFISHLARSTPNFILLSVLPFFAAIFQGVSSLNDMVNKKDITGWSRLEIILPGTMIGGARGSMTYFAKVPIAHDRAKKFLTCQNTWKDEVKYSAYSRKISQDLYLHFSYNSKTSWYKRYLLLSYYSTPLFYMSLAVFAALGTIAFYAGLGLFFSTSGLFYVLEFLLNPQGQATITDSNNGTQFIFSISTALLNGFWNQGYETVKSFYLSSLKFQERTHKLIDEPNATQKLEMPNMIRQIFYENTAVENVITFAILIDSFAASCTTFNGSTKILIAVANVMQLSDTHIVTLAGCMALGVFITQIFFSHELMEKDMRNGGKLWKTVYDVWFPTWIKNCIGIYNATTYPAPATSSHFFQPSSTKLVSLSTKDSTESLATSTGTIPPGSPKKKPSPLR